MSIIQSQSDIDKYLREHLPYRLNSLRAWDIYVSRRTKDKEHWKDEPAATMCYWTGELLEPALEISIIFGRSLLQFLGLKRDGKFLKSFSKTDLTKKEKHSVFIWDVNPGKSPYPIGQLNASEQRHLVNLIKVANKSTAHLTIQTSSEAELESLGYARQIIFRMMIDYVEGLDTSGLWWNTSP